MPNFLDLSLSGSFLTLALGGLGLVFFLLYLWQVWENWRITQNPKYYELLHKAIKKSEETLGNAELEAIKIVADSKFRSEKLENKYEAVLDSLSTKAGQSVHTLFEDFEQNISNYLTQTQQQSTEALELEMKSARQLIESYKTSQFKLIDENIVAMLERTLGLVLNKKMSLKDQMDLIYESLEKAKAEKFLV